MIEQRSYPAYLFRQRPNAPLQVAFVAPSSEIDSWARVPTKKTGNVRNFQRAEIPAHIAEVQDFFKNLNNSSPTAVVVGFDPIRAKTSVSLKVDGQEIADADVETGKPLAGSIEVKWIADPDPQARTQLLSTIADQLETLEGFIYSELYEITGGKLSRSTFSMMLENTRTLAREGQLDAIEAAEENSSDAIESSEDGAETEDDFTTLVEEKLPPVIREGLTGLSPSPKQVVLGRLSFLGRLQAEVLANMSDAQLRAVYREVADELKPAILIDGQHRIMGTKKLGQIPFLVTALPKAEWPELAFQFIVTNRTARRVAESLLISIVGQSLSKDQRAQIEERLREANIRVGLIEAVMRVHEDELSPFYGMIAFGLKNEPGFIDAAAMRGKVIKLWYERQDPVRELFAHLCEGKSQNEKTEYWKSEELWFECFCAFWEAVKERYKGTQVFSTELADKFSKRPVSRLMTATVLKIFQETVLIHVAEFLKQKAKSEKIPIASSVPTANDFKQLVTRTLEDLQPEFFTDWQLTGFDGSKGARDDLSGAIKSVIKGDKSVANLKSPQKPHRLFRKSDK